MSNEIQQAENVELTNHIYPITKVSSVTTLRVTCGTNQDNEKQKPLYTVEHNGDFVVATTDTLYAMQALLNRIN